MTETTKPIIFITVEGGIVQSICSDHPDAIGRVFVIDYDTDDADDDDLTYVPQDRGHEDATAYVGERTAEPWDIDFNELIRRVDSGETVGNTDTIEETT
jgi:hypothetical protein